MASRSGNKTTKRKPQSRSRKSTTRKKPTPAISLRPEHQREFFALALITIALGTLIFFVTDSAGGLGGVYLLGVQQLFGSGALILPLVLGLLGIGILIQERLYDADFSGANVLGAFLISAALLALLEFPQHTIPLPERQDGGSGGGMAGYGLVYLLEAAIGRPAAVLVVIVLGLAGVMLTFNMTLRELFGGIAELTRRSWAMAWSGSRRPAEPADRPARPKPGEIETPPYTPPPGANDDIMLTPIAARPTRASLFQRQSEVVPPTARQARVGAPERHPDINAPKSETRPAGSPPLPTPAPPPTTDPAPITETVQETLAGFGISPQQRAWPLPSLDILETSSAEGRMADEEIVRVSRLIEETLSSFKVEAQVVNVNPGPAVTQFELQPAPGVKVSKITSLEKDLALGLAAQSIRIEAPIPGKSAVGIEIPNSSIAVVSLREVMDSEDFEQSKARLKLPLGKDVTGNPIIADMTRMPHLLVAGATGSGKSVAINAFLCGLLFKHHPDELRLIMVDPKMVELIVYNRIPHLLSPVVTELERVVPTLKWATREMERRYKVFARHGCRNLDSYRQLRLRRPDLEAMPYILIVIDELADLMMMAPDEIETQICRLAQMARATGMHLIIATQRPSVDVITGLIKANFPSRIAFAVTSQVDSRVILDTQGAEHLLGRGDMLYMAADAARLVRIQGTYLADREVEQLVAFWRNARPPGSDAETAAAAGNSGTAQATKSDEARPAESNPQPAAEAAPASDAAAEAPLPPPGEYLSADEQDELLPQAVALVKQHQRASASLLQRRLRIGYSKAAQLIDLLEQQGIVGPPEGGRSRQVIHED
jgi:DNA segregation ATPase FtsK/SpoIIIE, S-DNA-T family